MTREGVTGKSVSVMMARAVTLRTLERLCRAFGVDVSHGVRTQLSPRYWSATLDIRRTPMKRSSVFAAALLVLSATAVFPHAVLAVPEKSVAAAPLEVTYYSLPTCPVCGRIKPAVSGLE